MISRKERVWIRLKDFKAIMVNGYMKNNSLWKEILKLDMSETLRKVQIPYTFLQGDSDIVASTQTVKDLVAHSNNLNLKCVIVENTGHMPGKEMMDKLMVLLEMV